MALYILECQIWKVACLVCFHEIRNEFWGFYYKLDSYPSLMLQDKDDLHVHEVLAEFVKANIIGHHIF